MAIQLCNGTAFADVTAPSTLKDHVKPEAGNKAVRVHDRGWDQQVSSITLKPTPIRRRT